jgi:hypothetical protein
MFNVNGEAEYAALLQVHNDTKAAFPNQCLLGIAVLSVQVRLTYAEMSHFYNHVAMPKCLA